MKLIMMEDFRIFIFCGGFKIIIGSNPHFQVNKIINIFILILP